MKEKQLLLLGDSFEERERDIERRTQLGHTPCARREKLYTHIHIQMHTYAKIRANVDG
jgi:hypothetical protein